jgi:hypothetical protein
LYPLSASLKNFLWQKHHKFSIGQDCRAFIGIGGPTIKE